MLKRLINVAIGCKKPDLVLKGAKVLNVFTEKLEEKDVALCAGLILGRAQIVPMSCAGRS